MHTSIVTEHCPGSKMIWTTKEMNMRNVMAQTRRCSRRSGCGSKNMETQLQGTRTCLLRAYLRPTT